jgi:hypothetical protein
MNCRRQFQLHICESQAARCCSECETTQTAKSWTKIAPCVSQFVFSNIRKSDEFHAIVRRRDLPLRLRVMA